MGSASPPTICASPNFTFPPSSSTSSHSNDSAANNQSDDYFSLMSPVNIANQNSSINHNNINTATSFSKSKIKDNHTQSPDYFTGHFVKPRLLSTSTNSSLSSNDSSTIHKNYNDSISSINSDSTVCEVNHHSSNSLSRSKKIDLSLTSTDTLVDEASFTSSSSSSLSQTKHNHLNLKLSIPNSKHKNSSSNSNSFPLHNDSKLSFPVNERDELMDHESIHNSNKSWSQGTQLEFLQNPFTKASSAVEARFPHNRNPSSNDQGNKEITTNDVSTPQINNALNKSSGYFDQLAGSHNNYQRSHSTILAPTLVAPPSLSKNNTLPSIPFNHDLTVESIKKQQVKRLNQLPQQPNYHDQLQSLSPQIIKYINFQELDNLIKNTEIDPVLKLPNFLMIDIRPFADYISNHVIDSINVCLPSTLLKRSNFGLKRCINSLPDYEKLIFLNYLAMNDDNKRQNKIFENSKIKVGKFGLPAILLYENNNNSQNLYHMCKKFIDNSFWDQESQPPIYLLDFEFNQIPQSYLESGKLEKFKIVDSISSTPSPIKPADVSSPKQNLPTRPKSSSMNEVPTLASVRQRPLLTMKNLTLQDCSTPILPNFKLPTNLTNQFKIRHNEELIEDGDFKLSQQSTFKLNYYDESMVLPNWIKNAIDTNSDIIEEFTKLEKFEKRRLNLALGNSTTTPMTSLHQQSNNMNPFFPTLDSSSSLISPGGTTIESSPSISCGLDYGHKNRYKDIFLYDHSRVKLNDFDKPQQCDYINASYLNPINNLADLLIDNHKDGYGSLTKMLKYIATQGPLDQTIGDFWKCVVNHHVPLVLSLTNEFEDGIKKCARFWESGTYKSNDNMIQVELLNEEQVKSNDEIYMIIRHFKIIMDNTIVHETLQVQLLTWPDMSSCLTPKDLVLIIALKNHLLQNIRLDNVEYPTIIHCSAGCGRTGTLCTIDSIINIIKYNSRLNDGERNIELNFNPVYSMVNNFRKQRISMVQTLRQYYLIYDTLLIYLNDRKKAWNDLTKLQIVNDFIKKN